VPNETFQEIGEALLANVDAAKRKELTDRLAKMIDYAIKRQDWYEDQRNKTLSLGIALLGLSSFLVAGLLSAAIEPMVYFRAFAGLTLISIVCTASWIILEYISGGSENYTHRGLADIRSWFFAYVVKDPVAKAAITDVDNAEKNREILFAAWKKFVIGWMEYEGHPNGFIAEDLQQVFILYLFQAMRRHSLRRMIFAAQIGAIVIALFLVPTITCAALRI
jgi:hypothetical protein